MIRRKRDVTACGCLHDGLRLGVAFGLVVLLLALVALAAGPPHSRSSAGAASTRHSAPRTVSQQAKVATLGRVRLNQDEWHERLKVRDFWTSRRGPGGGSGRYQRALPSPPPHQWAQFQREDMPWPRFSPGDTYRTVCVRLCDGYFWPVSFSTTGDGFARDQAACDRSCTSPSRLYVYRNPGEEPQDMRSVEGQPYSKLPTAFLYRAKYDAQCRCGPQPWDKEALDRHRIYALEAAQRKGDRSAGQELVQLRARREAERQRQAARRTLLQSGLRSGVASAGSAPPTPQIVILRAPAAHAAPLVPPVAAAPVRTTPPARPALAAAPPAPARPAAAPQREVVIMRLGVGASAKSPPRDNAQVERRNPRPRPARAN
jgi:hypothetical protein